MNQNDEIRRRLSGVTSDEPPENLLQNIQNEIPADFAALAAKRPSALGARWWQVAALLVVFVGVGFFAWQASRDPLSPDFDDIAVRTEPRLAPERGRVLESESVAEGRAQSPELQATQESATQQSELFAHRSMQTTEAGSAASAIQERALAPAASTMPGQDLMTRSDAVRDRAEAITVQAAAPLCQNRGAPPPRRSLANKRSKNVRSKEGLAMWWAA
jgi:hypothetical protein